MTSVASIICEMSRIIECYYAIERLKSINDIADICDDCLIIVDLLLFTWNYVFI